MANISVKDVTEQLAEALRQRAARTVRAGAGQIVGYGAAYLWLAAEPNAPLATFDEKLAAAAQTHLGKLP